MNIWEAVGTFFNGGLVLRNHGATTKSTVGWVDVDDEELGSGWYNLSDHEKEARRVPSLETVAFASTNFSPISPGEQCLVLLMCALVGCLPLILLDEAWSGMDDEMIAAARRYLCGDFTVGTDGMAGIGEDQACYKSIHHLFVIIVCNSTLALFIH